MSSDKRNVEITDIDNGYCVALLNDELRAAYADLRNPNKIANSKREITLKLVLSATKESRKEADVKYAVSSKLGAREGGKSQIYLAGAGEEVESGLVPMNQPSFEFNNNQAN